MVVGYSVGSGGRTENSLDLDGFDVLRFRSNFLQVARVPSLTLDNHIIAGSSIMYILWYCTLILVFVNADCGRIEDEKGE